MHLHILYGDKGHFAGYTPSAAEHTHARINHGDNLRRPFLGDTKTGGSVQPGPNVRHNLTGICASRQGSPSNLDCHDLRCSHRQRCTWKQPMIAKATDVVYTVLSVPSGSSSVYLHKRKKQKQEHRKRNTEKKPVTGRERKTALETLSAKMIRRVFRYAWFHCGACDDLLSSTIVCSSPPPSAHQLQKISRSRLASHPRGLPLLFEQLPLADTKLHKRFELQ